MIIPVRCFTCGKVLSLILIIIIGCWQQVEQVLGSPRRGRHERSVSYHNWLILNWNIVRHWMTLAWRDTAAEEWFSLMLTWFQSFSTTTVKINFLSYVFRIVYEHERDWYVHQGIYSIYYLIFAIILWY